MNRSNSIATACGTATKTSALKALPAPNGFIEDVGFANTLTDTRRAGPSLYIAVCGRRDVSLPRTIQKKRQKNPRLTD